SEELEEQRLEVRREGPKPVDDVSIQKLATDERVRDDPLPARVDERIRPTAPRHHEEGRGRERDRNRGGREAGTAAHVTTAGRSTQRSHAPVSRISSIAAKAASSSSSPAEKCGEMRIPTPGRKARHQARSG